MTKIISPRRIALLAVCFCTLLASLLAAGCSKRESVTVQVDVAKSVDVWNMARSPGANVRVAASGFTMVAGMDEVLRKAINTDEFRALAICKHLAQRDDPQQTRLLDALAEMCAWSVRETPAAVRVTVTGSDTKEATAIANLVGRTLSEAAMVTAAANLATRREIEYQTLARLETKARDMESTVRRIESLGESDGTTDTLATRTASEQARVWARLEIMTRELRVARSDVEQVRARARVFEDIEATVVACPCWIVPPSASNETGWTTLDRLDAGVTVLALVNPASGRPWLTDSLSQSDKTLAAAVGDVDVSTTKWRVAFDPKPGVSTVSFPSGAESAAADLARRVRAAPVGDGTVVTLGLTGDVSAKDRRAILDALTRYILTKKRQDITLDAVNRMDPIDRRITMLSTEFRERDRAFLELAEHTTATRETIASLYDSSREGQEIERVQLALAALRKERDTIDRESHSNFDDLFLIRYVQRTE